MKSKQKTSRIQIVSCRILSDEPMVCWCCGQTTTPHVEHTCRSEA